MKTNNWIHFIGKSYYGMNAFIKEAKQLGVSRAISFEVFKKMNLGDRIFLAQKDGASTKIFGYFQLQQIYGAGDDLFRQLRQSGAVTVLSNECYHVERGCGSFTVSATASIDKPELLMTILKKAKPEDFNRLMIGGILHPLKDSGIDEDYILSDIPFQMGYRRFDFDLFSVRYIEAVGNNSRKVRGQFYYKDVAVGTHILVTDPKLLIIDNYRLN